MAEMTIGRTSDNFAIHLPELVDPVTESDDFGRANEGLLFIPTLQGRIDVGTQSVRCALVDSSGIVKTVAIRPIQTWSPSDNLYQQSSENIWQACCASCKDVISSSEIDKSLIDGIGFDATCSLVVLDKHFNPLSVNLKNDNDEIERPVQDVIMWMDHRAATQAHFINAKNYDSLKSVGGKISLEMQPPKLLWLKENMPKKWWQNAGYFMDLPDYLTWRATKSLTRSLCSVTCKWLFSGDGNLGWDKFMWKQIGLQDVLQDTLVLEPGKACGSGLTSESAQELGLKAEVAVGASLIDAYAGALGLLACNPAIDLHLQDVSSKLAIICGTSTCHIAISQIAKFVPGVWGPYFSVLIPKFWTNEGGQSVTGKLLDYIITSHPSFIRRSKPDQDLNLVYKELHQHLLAMHREEKNANVAHLADQLHVYPDFHGNRSPLADSSLKGMVCGLTLNSSIRDLAIYYLATIQALAYSTKQIIGAMETAGHSFRCILMCGGLAKNDLYVTTHADVMGLPVIRPNEPESVLLGSAMLGAVAAGEFTSLENAMNRMGGEGHVTFPQENTRL
uniref:Carbohydrate kinase FGGY C-terminal domain-containing protein n=1 Tax=Strigamia maritima TaxID=126957 RepID=T1JIY2_STRMM